MAKIFTRFKKNLICEDVLLDLKETAEKNKANLRKADFFGADLRGADLRKADLFGADLYGADLRGADLREADLREADLRWADLREANLRGANIKDKIIINYKEIAGIGREERQLRCFMFDNNSFYFMAGCFSGLEEELRERVIEKYGNDCEYLEAIEFLKNLCIKYKIKNDK